MERAQHLVHRLVKEAMRPGAAGPWARLSAVPPAQRNHKPQTLAAPFFPGSDRTSRLRLHAGCSGRMQNGLKVKMSLLIEKPPFTRQKIFT